MLMRLVFVTLITTLKFKYTSDDNSINHIDKYYKLIALNAP